MGGIATGRGGAQLLEAQVVHIRGDVGKPLGQVLEGLLDVSHLRSLPPRWRVAATARWRGDAQVILRVGQQAR